MISSVLKDKIHQGIPVIGVLSPTSDGILCEYSGLAGLDFYMIDAEHGAVDAATAQHLIRACYSVSLPCLARVGSRDEKIILQYLDAGIEGIMMPGLATAKDVYRAIDAVRYPPVGKRGLGPVRAADFLMGEMNQLEYVTFANENILLLPQIEDISLVNEIDDILNLEGVDGFVIGPRDLAMSMGYYEGPAHQEVQDMVDSIIKKVIHAGKLCGTVAGNARQANELIEKGVHFVLNSVQGIYVSGIKKFLQPIKR